MRLGHWILMAAVLLWSVDRDGFITRAYAIDGGSTGQQLDSQDKNKKNNDDGGDQSNAAGLAAIAAGMAMVAAGMALMANPPTMPAGIALIMAGMALIAAGLAALAAGKKAKDNADKSGQRAGNLDSYNPYKSTISTDPTATSGTTETSQLGDGGNADLGKGGGTGIKIDPALLRQGKMDGIYTDLEKKTGIPRDDFLKAMQNGADPLGMLANSPALAGKPFASADNLQKMMDSAVAKGLPSGQEVMDKLGLTKDDLGGGSPLTGGGADPNRKMASVDPTANMDALFPPKEVPNGPAGGNTMGLSPEVQAALEKKGVFNTRSIFQIVHDRYLVVTPMLMGVPKKMDGTSLNPFAGLGPDSGK